MNKHYILNLNPQADSDWDRCTLRNPITGERPDLTTEIAKFVGDRPGSYLIKVKLEVEVLEQNLTNSHNTVELPTGKKSTVITKYHHFSA
ncbi:hypothetical protein IQ255_27865 [Pleurocapsales cyanobacterium LEGE 10410]|nr:hypothetical protein [Pleurocapsales cyanobacterium LEGE 10410]